MRKRFSAWTVTCVLAPVLALAVGCEGAAGGKAQATDAALTGDAAAGTADSTDDGTAEDTAADAVAPADAGPEPPAPGPYAGTCPTLATGKNVLGAAGFQRRFVLDLPAKPEGAPVVFVWHGLGDNASNMAAALGTAKLAAERGAIVVTPDGCCNHPDNKGCCTQVTGWGFAGKPEPDLALFDDALACLDQQFGFDRKRVYTTGFSAGALWSTYLTLHRAERLAAAALWSGGVNDFLPYATPARPVPVLVSWGGPTDLFGNGLVDFHASAKALIEALGADGHFLVACNHGKGHTIPFGGPAWAADFLFAHTWGDASWPLAAGLPPGYPSYCTLP